MNSEIAMRQRCATNPVPTTTSCHRKRRALTGSLVCAPRCVEDLCVRAPPCSLSGQLTIHRYGQCASARACVTVAPMLGQEHSRTISPDMLSEATLYKHFFAKEIERIRHSPYPHPDDMKIAEVSSVFSGIRGINSKCPRRLLVSVQGRVENNCMGKLNGSQVHLSRLWHRNFDIIMLAAERGDVLETAPEYHITTDLSNGVRFFFARNELTKSEHDPNNVK